MKISTKREKTLYPSLPSYGFAPQSADGVMIEIQHLNWHHMLNRMGLHSHTFFEFIYFERGGGIHALGGVRSQIQSGSLFVVCPGELHNCCEIGRAEGWVVLFTRAALEHIPESLAFSRGWLPRHPLFDPFLSLAIRSRNSFTKRADVSHPAIDNLILDKQQDELNQLSEIAGKMPQCHWSQFPLDRKQSLEWQTADAPREE